MRQVEMQKVPDTTVPIQENLPEDAKIGWESILTGILPPEAKLRFHLDYDRDFVVLYPTLVMENRTWRMEIRKDGNDGVMVYLSLVMNILKYAVTSYGFRWSSNYPGLLTLQLDRNTFLLDFLLEGVPALIRLGTVYYTDNFKRKMVRKQLNLSIRWGSGNLGSLLECTFSYDGDLDAEDMALLLDAVEDERRSRYHVLKNGGFVDLRAENVVETLMFLKRLGITEKELEERRIQIPKCDVPWFAEQLQQAKIRGIADIGVQDVEALKRGAMGSGTVTGT